MPTFTVGARKFRKVLYSSTRRRRKIEVELEADGCIDVHIIQRSDLPDWKAGHTIRGANFKRRKSLQFTYEIEPDFEDNWYLIFDNVSDDAVAVHYDIYDV